MRSGIALLMMIYCVVAGAESSLTVYVYPPRAKLDWSTPNTLLSDLAGIGVGSLIDDHLYLEGRSDFNEKYRVPINYRSTMGHTVSKINCKLPNGRLYKKWSSFSGQSNTELTSDLIFSEQIGFGGMFYDFNDGYIIAGQENYDKLITYNGVRLRSAKGNLKQVTPRYIKVKVTPYDCSNLKKMVEFFEGFHYKKDSSQKDLDLRGASGNLHFTTNIDPFDSYKARMNDSSVVVGGGCAPYGIALLKEAEFYDNELDKALMLDINVSHKLIGGNGKKVSVSSILFSDLGTSWEHEGFEGRTFSQYDPQLLWDFVGQLRSCLGKKEFEQDHCSESASSYLKRNQHLHIEAQAPEVVEEELNIKGVIKSGRDQEAFSEKPVRRFEMHGVLLSR